VYNATSLAVCSQALMDSGHEILTDEISERTGLIFGSDRSSVMDIRRTHEKVLEGGYSKLDRFIIPKFIASQAVGSIGMPLRIRGYANSISAGLPVGLLAIKDAFRVIQVGEADVMLAGAAEVEFDTALLMSFYKSGFLSRGEDPMLACRPFETRRDGWVYSVGAGAVVLEELEHAKKRGARIYAEVAGGSCCADTESAERDGNGQLRAMKIALKQAKVEGSEVDLVVADAPGWKHWDETEALAISRLCPDCSVTSNKGNLGHMQAASGAAQVVEGVLSIYHSKIPQIPNLISPCSKAIELISTQPLEIPVTHAITNSFSYDSTCFTSLVFKKFG